MGIHSSTYYLYLTLPDFGESDLVLLASFSSPKMCQIDYGEHEYRVYKNMQLCTGGHILYTIGLFCTVIIALRYEI